ncbi:ATP synthase F(0) complex subunit e, mitochondrial isoform X1 [Pteropus medius]|uniref:ATP synthase subunit e, mitochondrial isoform X1 n=1 Tax=Pteropus vampyrus TaxID=132908 RepID=UPI00196A34B1|nr:ATP synthase subunit e, mitochondrial isoform X1 [Pteropus giganteus]
MGPTCLNRGEKAPPPAPLGQASGKGACIPGPLSPRTWIPCPKPPASSPAPRAPSRAILGAGRGWPRAWTGLDPAGATRSWVGGLRARSRPGRTAAGGTGRSPLCTVCSTYVSGVRTHAVRASTCTQPGPKASEAAAGLNPGSRPRAAATAHAQPTPRPVTSHAPESARMLFRCEGHGQDGAAGAGLSAHQGEPGFAAAARCSAPRSPPPRPLFRPVPRHGLRSQALQLPEASG